MKAFRKYFVFLVIALGLSAQCFAAQNTKACYDESQVCENYYIQPGSVYVAPGGIFVWIDGQLAQVSMLCSDEKGVFVPYEEMGRQFVQCPNCRNWYNPDGPPHKCPGPR